MPCKVPWHNRIIGLHPIFCNFVAQTQNLSFMWPDGYRSSIQVFHEHCVKSVRIRSYSGPHFLRIFPHSDWIWRDTDFPHSDWIRRDTRYLSVFSPNTGKFGKIADQNKSEYGHFLRSGVFLKYHNFLRSSVLGDLWGNLHIHFLVIIM